ncbi:MAG: hypothetical protein QN194_14915 [Armatimonadota bacterium]|nr:hypothetical protein [Armatimonadota bacterium]
MVEGRGDGWLELVFQVLGMERGKGAGGGRRYPDPAEVRAALAGAPGGPGRAPAGGGRRLVHLPVAMNERVMLEARKRCPTCGLIGACRCEPDPLTTRLGRLGCGRCRFPLIRGSGS